jgi:hypothetical protein
MASSLIHPLFTMAGFGARKTVLLSATSDGGALAGRQ